MEKIELFTIDLTTVKGKGEVKCPKCGTKISPDDTSEKVYMILEPIVRENQLERIVLRCNRCQCKISLTGFAFLEESEQAS